MPERQIGVGVVGYGLAGRVFHAPLIAASPDLELRAIATSREAEVAAAYPGVPAVTVDRLFADPSVELVVVAAPNTAHFELARRALDTGRHVVVDKPFTIRSADADALIVLAEPSGRVLSVYQNRRWDADFLTLRRVIGEGTLGAVRTFYGRFERWDPYLAAGWREADLPGSGLLYDLGAHLIDQALVLFGRPRTVQCVVRRQRAGAVVDDFFHLVLAFDGTDAILECSSLIRPDRDRLEAYGERGSFRKAGLDVQDGQINAGKRPGDPEWGIDRVPARVSWSDESGRELSREIAPERGCYECYYAGVAAAIRGEAAPPVSARDARDVIRVVEYAIESATTGRTVTTEWAAG